MASRSLRDRLSHAWNVFKLKDDPLDSQIPSYGTYFDHGVGTTTRTDRTRLRPSTERSIVASIYNKIAIDVAAVAIRHARVNDDGQYQDTIVSGLNRCLNVEANIDQTGQEFIFDATLSMFDEGVVALVPVDTSISLKNSNAYDILSIRTGKIKQWYPKDVRVEVYNDNTGNREEIVLPKNKIAIVQNPFYAIMNEQNSTLHRLKHKMALLDTVDNRNYDTKLNMILQLPYTIKTEARKKIADERLKDLETQLEGSSYGLAYVDGTEKVIQLNRSLDNKLLEQVEDLKKQLYSELGITESVFDGTADEKTMLNYQNTTVKPVLDAFVNEMTRKFLTKTAQTQGQRIVYVNNPFKLVPVNEIAEIADKFTRNEITSSNEMRSVIGLKPVNDARADELRNKNLNISDEQMQSPLLTTDEEYQDQYAEEEYPEEEYYEEEEYA